MTQMIKKKKPIPFEFVLEELNGRPNLMITTKPMFGCTAIYNSDKIVMILRDRPKYPEANGIWLCTSTEHHPSLRKLFPKMKDLEIFGKGPTNWQVLSSGDDDFESSAFKACDLVIKGDLRIGKVPERKIRPKKPPKRKKKT